MAQAKAKSKDPEIQIKAKMSGAENWKKWGTMKSSDKSSHGSGGALYFVGFIGSLVYWTQAAIGFMAVVTGFLKSMVWPAYIIYKLLENFYGIV